jgi:hypothetical protein
MGNPDHGGSVTYRNPKLLRLARDEACANCGAEDGTIVAAHSNLSRHGKGKSLKAADCFIAFLCHRCHSWLDQGLGMDSTERYTGTRADKAEMFAAAMDATTLRLWERGRVKVA